MIDTRFMLYLEKTSFHDGDGMFFCLLSFVFIKPLWKVGDR